MYRLTVFVVYSFFSFFSAYTGNIQCRFVIPNEHVPLLGRSGLGVLQVVSTSLRRTQFQVMTYLRDSFSHAGC